MVLYYSHILCPFSLQGFPCPKSEHCLYSHNGNESFYHPVNYKTTMCIEYPFCLRELCPWAHSPEELRDSSISGNYIMKIESESPLWDSERKLEPKDDLILIAFKTKPCTCKEQHNQKHCLFYHSPKDRRRISTNYLSELCNKNDNDNCPMKDFCGKSHSMVEKLYHPDKYKTKYCNFYPKSLQNCIYGSYCCFAHSDQELKVEILHYLELYEDFYLYYFKTGWCPFNIEHNKAICIYAHNWQDFRRKPHLFNYTNEPCPNWQPERLDRKSVV